jgi:PilZ domain-containing protein
MSGPKQSTSPAANGKAGPLHDDRRSHPRYPFTAAAEVTDMKSQARLNTRISDLGLEGAYADTTSPFPLGTVVRIRITNGSRAFETQATVTYALANMGMGLSFAPPEPEQLWVLQKWLDEVSGKTPPEPTPSAPNLHQHAEPIPADIQLAVLQDLVTTLMRKGTISYSEGTAMLQRLLR